VSETAQKTPWWKAQWARWAGAVLLPAALAVVCPLLPWPAAQLVCKAAGHVVTEVAKQSAAPSPSTAPSSGACEEGKVQSVPNFCRCVNGQWADYFDGGACGP
jgi:hypothetical protein